MLCAIQALPFRAPREGHLGCRGRGGEGRGGDQAHTAKNPSALGYERHPGRSKTAIYLTVNVDEFIWKCHTIEFVVERRRSNMPQ